MNSGYGSVAGSAGGDGPRGAAAEQQHDATMTRVGRALSGSPGEPAGFARHQLYSLASAPSPGVVNRSM